MIDNTTFSILFYSIHFLFYLDHASSSQIGNPCSDSNNSSLKDTRDLDLNAGELERVVDISESDKPDRDSNSESPLTSTLFSDEDTEEGHCQLECTEHEENREEVQQKSTLEGDGPAVLSPDLDNTAIISATSEKLCQLECTKYEGNRKEVQQKTALKGGDPAELPPDLDNTSIISATSEGCDDKSETTPADLKAQPLELSVSSNEIPALRLELDNSENSSFNYDNKNGPSVCDDGSGMKTECGDGACVETDFQTNKKLEFDNHDQNLETENDSGENLKVNCRNDENFKTSCSCSDNIDEIVSDCSQNSIESGSQHNQKENSIENNNRPCQDEDTLECNKQMSGTPIVNTNTELNDFCNSFEHLSIQNNPDEREFSEQRSENCNDNHSESLDIEVGDKISGGNTEEHHVLEEKHLDNIVEHPVSNQVRQHFLLFLVLFLRIFIPCLHVAFTLIN